MSKYGFTTQLVHNDKITNNPEYGGVHTSTSQSVLFNFEDAQDLVDVFQGKKAGHVYSRSSSGSVNALQDMLNTIDGGVGCICFATGMAAISSTMLALLRAGDHLIVSKFLFGNTLSFMKTLINFGVEISFVDVTNVNNVIKHYQKNTRMVFCESIANPGTQVSELPAIGDFCEQKSIIFTLDNTMTPSYLLDARQVKASLLLCSLTKYIGGHGNVLGGSVVDTGIYQWAKFENIRTEYRVKDQQQWGLTQIKKLGLRDMGSTLAPESASKIAVGMETMALRLNAACDNAMSLAAWLDSHSQVSKVFYPGLKAHRQNQLATSLFHKFGAILSIELSDNIDPIVFLNNLKLVLSATHLGDTRTLALPVAATIFHENGAQVRTDMGVSDTLIRISVGIENIDDLIDDFKQAFKALL